MSTIMSRTFGKKMSFGRLSMPVWLVAAAGLAVVAAAGQAVGPVLAGSVTGTAAVVAEQSVVLGGESSISGAATGDDLIVENDEGTSFTAAIEMHVGDQGETINLDVSNVSNASANAVLELNVPAGIDVEVESEGSDLEEAQMGPGTWLLRVAPGNDDDLQINVEPKDDAKPGFYTITGRIVQISG